MIGEKITSIFGDTFEFIEVEHEINKYYTLLLVFETCTHFVNVLGIVVGERVDEVAAHDGAHVVTLKLYYLLHELRVAQQLAGPCQVRQHLTTMFGVDNKSLKNSRAIGN